MKRLDATPHPIAVLTASTETQFSCAVLTSEISAGVDGWYQLLPAGSFTARDNRPTDTVDGQWHLDAESAASLIAATKAAAPKVLIDYEHATLIAKKTGQEAPAAAWLTAATDIEWREGKGLYIRPEWNARAQKMIDEKEYAYLSAVFPYDKQGHPLMLRMAAITNDPGLVNIDPVASLAADLSISLHTPEATANLFGKTGDDVLNELLKQMLAKLGITMSTEPTPEQATTALSALDVMIEKSGQVNELTTQVAALTAQGGAVDLAQYVPIQTYTALQSQFVTLSAQTSGNSIDAAIKAARESGKVMAAEESYLKQYGEQKGFAALSSMLEARPAIPALTTEQVLGGKPPREESTAVLSAEESQVAKVCGLSPEDFLKTKNGAQS